MKSNETILVTGHLAIINFAQNFNRTIGAAAIRFAGLFSLYCHGREG